MSSFGDLDRLRRQNKELLHELKHKTDILARVHLDCAGKQSGFVLAKRSAREPTTLQEGSESLLNVSDDLINLSVRGNCPEKARSALCKQINITKTPNLAGEKPETEAFKHDHFLFVVMRFIPVSESKQYISQIIYTYK